MCNKAVLKLCRPAGLALCVTPSFSSLFMCVEKKKKCRPGARLINDKLNATCDVCSFIFSLSVCFLYATLTY